jgi:hypothetical protein
LLTSALLLESRLFTYKNNWQKYWKYIFEGRYTLYVNLIYL